LFAAGFLARLWLAGHTFLDPDEAWHYLLSVQPSAWQAYQASLRTTHPPLLILLLHFTGWIGATEWLLRLPSVLAGLGFCWIAFRWVEVATDRVTALLSLVLFLFLPPLIQLSAEVRQYTLLLFFVAGSLYWFDRGLARNSARGILFSAIALDLALLSHYAALIFALSHGLYGLARLAGGGVPGAYGARGRPGKLWHWAWPAFCGRPTWSRLSTGR
jgi:4-amino-4-deoxy-L-arabinose transferase-like glycosyltransferase